MTIIATANCERATLAAFPAVRSSKWATKARTHMTTHMSMYVWKCATTQSVLWKRKLRGITESITAPTPPIVQPAKPT